MTADPATLRALADRCEAARGALAGPDAGETAWTIFRDSDRYAALYEALKGSLDYAALLVRLALPVATVDLTITKERSRAQVHWWPAGALGVKAIYTESEAATPALALTAATLRAYAAQIGEKP